MADGQDLAASRAEPRRRAAGIAVRRWLPLTPELWQQVEEIYNDVLELPAAERPAALDGACGGDRELRREVESLLAGATGDEDFTPLISLRPDSVETMQLPSNADAVSAIGQRIGPYVLERLLGQGGMGSVYLGRRTDGLEMVAAIKVLRRGMNTEEIVRRFGHERQILAKLDHPNIAKLFDGGTTGDEMPYFVMEYVEGEPIDRYCEQRGLDIRQRLELFRKVCSAVHLAHQNLIVHRDIKPSNIMVGTDGEPKLLDFGIAKPLDTPGSSASVLTASGVRPMTLKYASPEQVGGDQITTASDVYSLGVVLYELLTGRWPYPEAGSKWLDLANAIQQQQPRRPSTAFGPAAPDRPTGGSRRRLASDLDSIVLTALAKRPERRYPSAEQLSADIRRHLEGMPVTARKLTFAYWTGKLVRRHKLGTAMAATVLATILGFILYIVGLKDEAVQLKNEAVSESQRAEEVSRFLVQLFKAPGPNQARGKEVTAREVLDLGKERIREYRGSDPRLYARLASTMGEVYYGLGHYAEAQSLLEAARASLRDHLAGEADPQLASVINDLAAMHWAQGRFLEAERYFQEALGMKTLIHGDGALELVVTLNNLGTLARERGALDEAEQRYRQGLAILRRPASPFSERPATIEKDIAASQFLLGTLLLDTGGYQEAETHLRQALATRSQLFGTENTSVAVTLHNLGISLQYQGQAAESEEIYREALEIQSRLLGEQHPEVAATEINFASLLVSTGDYETAERLGRKALESLRKSSPGHWRTAQAESVLGSCLAAMGRFEEAEPLLTKSYKGLARAKLPCSRYTIDALGRLIDLYDAWGRMEKNQEYQTFRNSCL